MRQRSYTRHRLPPVILRHAVELDFRFALSSRDVEVLLAERGIDASYEAVPTAGCRDKATATTSTRDGR